MRAIYFFTISSLFFSLAAQNYQGINSSREAAFSNGTEFNGFQFAVIDSVAADGSDSIYYHRKQISTEDSNFCNSIDKASWMGSEIRIREDGVHIFTNRVGDSIFLHSQARLGDKWIAYRSSETQIYAEAEITEHDTMSFLGLIDSVKTISFQLYDSLGNLHYLDVYYLAINDYEFKMSKNFGFVQFQNLFEYGDFETFYLEFYPYYSTYEIAGLSNLQIGLSNIKWLEVNDHDVGDELHILEVDKCFSNGDQKLDSTRIKWTILSRADYTDSIQYEILREVRFTREDANGVISQENHILDTFFRVFVDNEEFNKYPGEAVSELPVNDQISSGIAVTFKISEDTKFYDEDDHWLETEGCWVYNYEPYNALSNPGKRMTFIRGLGGPYYWTFNPWCVESEELRQLVAYKKGGIVSGKPWTEEDLFVSAEPNLDPSHKFDLFPNPASRTVTLDFSQIGISLASVQFIDTHGKVCLSTMSEASRTEIDISSLHPGLFFVEMRSEGRVIGIEKFVVQ